MTHNSQYLGISKALPTLDGRGHKKSAKSSRELSFFSRTEWASDAENLFARKTTLIENEEGEAASFRKVLQENSGVSYSVRGLKE